MVTGIEDYESAALTVKNAIRVLLKNDMTELFAIAAEVANARDGETTLLAAITAKVAAVVTDLVNDTTPQLGGDLDMNGKSIQTVTPTEMARLHGITDSIMTLLGAKQATITGAATTIDTEDLTASRALISNASGKVEASTVTSTQLAAAAVVDAAAGTGSLRTIGTSATSACAGNDARLSDSRTPSGPWLPANKAIGETVIAWSFATLGTSAISAGSTVAGSQLYYTSGSAGPTAITDSASISSAQLAGMTAMSGTWRALIYCKAGLGQDSTNYSSLFLRIA